MSRLGRKVLGVGPREAAHRLRLGKARFHAYRTPQPGGQPLDRYFLIVGHPRSGSTLLAALLDAHRDVGVAHEGEILRAAAEGKSKNSLIAMTHFHCSNFRRLGFAWEGFDYQIGEQQGLPGNCRVLGDKSAGRASDLLSRRPGAVADLAATLGVPVTTILLERNPLDVVATMMRKGGPTFMGEAETFGRHSRRVEALSRLEEFEAMDVHTVHHADLCANPRDTLKGVLEALDVEHDNRYLDLAAGAVNPVLSRSSEARRWEPETLRLAAEMCERTDRLNRYRSEIDSLQTV